MAFATQHDQRHNPKHDQRHEESTSQKKWTAARLSIICYVVEAIDALQGSVQHHNSSSSSATCTTRLDCCYMSTSNDNVKGDWNQAFGSLFGDDIQRGLLFIDEVTSFRRRVNKTLVLNHNSCRDILPADKTLVGKNGARQKVFLASLFLSLIPPKTCFATKTPNFFYHSLSRSMNLHISQ